jgi:transposase
LTEQNVQPGAGKRRRKRLLTPSEKYEIWVQLLTGELTQREAARQWQVDPTTIIRIRKVAKDGALAALAASRPGGAGDPRDAELEAARAEVARLSAAVTELSIENVLLRGKARWG